jgi:DNA transformation protein
MTPDDLIDLFSEFGPITLKRAFSGYAISADGVNFAMALKSGLIFRVDDETVQRYEAEGCKPFQYTTRARTVVVQSYRVLPERLYDDPEELAVWAREAVGAAHRARLKKGARVKAKKSTRKQIAPKAAATTSRKRKSQKSAAGKRKTTRKAAKVKTGKR